MHIRVESKKLARSTDRQTSHDAAKSLSADRQIEMLVAYYHLRGKPEIPYLAARQAPGKQGGDCPWHRAGDLQKEGYLDFVYDEHGEPMKKRSPHSGREQTLYIITLQGRREYRELRYANKA